MYTFLMVVQVLVAVALIGLILLQQGKGADAGAAFGSGSSSTVFGARGSANFLSRSTAWLATVFFAVSLALAYLISGSVQKTGSVVDKLEQVAPAPVTDAAPAAEVPATATPEPTVPADTSPKVPE